MYRSCIVLSATPVVNCLFLQMHDHCVWFPGKYLYFSATERLMFFSISECTLCILKRSGIAFCEYEIVFHAGRTYGNGIRYEGNATLLFIHILRKLQ